MKIEITAKYQNESKVGLIQISKIVGNKPLEYALHLFENNSIRLQKTKFTTIKQATTHASLYGFLTNLWEVEEIEY